MAYVIVWENNTFGQAIKGQSWPGHVSMSVTDYLKEKDDHHEYVSWCPSKQVTRVRNAYVPAMNLFGNASPAHVATETESVSVRSKGGAGKSRAVLGTSIVEDIIYEGFLPDHVIHLPTTLDQERQMRNEWSLIAQYAQYSRTRTSLFSAPKEVTASYREFRKNAATVVSRVLHAGGFHARKWAVDSNWAWTPADVAKLARKAGGTNITWTAFLSVLNTGGITPADFDWVTQARSRRCCTTGVPCRF